METLQEQLQLQCFRCGHEWLRRTVHSLPKQCPLCHSTLWNWNIVENDEAKAEIKEQTRELHRELFPKATDQEFEQRFERVYAKTVLANKRERHAVATVTKDIKKTQKRAAK